MSLAPNEDVAARSGVCFFFQKSARAKEKHRAASVAVNADVRRTKARLLEEVVKLQKIAATKVVLHNLLKFRIEMANFYKFRSDNM